MTDVLDHLIDALRTELQQYGEILSLLDLQEQAVKQQGAEEILRIVAAIHAQSAHIEAARAARQHWQQQLALALGLSPDATLSHLTTLVPEPYRLLLLALVQENNDLRRRVREQAEQNQALLRRAMALLEQVLATFTGPGLLGQEPVEPAPALELAADPTQQRAVA
jgi:Na+/phosphate symporter